MGVGVFVCVCVCVCTCVCMCARVRTREGEREGEKRERKWRRGERWKTKDGEQKEGGACNLMRTMQYNTKFLLLLHIGLFISRRGSC